MPVQFPPNEGTEISMEDAFFTEQNAELLAQIRKKREAVAAKQALQEASGISDDAVLDQLVTAGIEAEELIALSMVPMIQVAWADRVVQDAERSAILQAAGDAGVHQGDESFKLLTNWLSEQPSSALTDTWKAYVIALAKVVSPATLASLKDEWIGNAHRVAESAGGILGFGSISDAEQKVLDDLAAAFG